MTTRLSEILQPASQFARSVNIERDVDARGLSGYLPTGRALDVLRRFAAAMANPSLTRAWSITGPYGSGKSSLALLLESLAGPADARIRGEALRLIGGVDKVVASDLRAALALVGGEDGFIRAAVNAQREPVQATILRALVVGLERFTGSPRRRAALRREADRLLAGPSTAREIADLAEAVAKLAPVLLVVDEFGKNLEFFADRPADADLFVLQEIVERSSGPNGAAIFVVTLQHLAFDDYATNATPTQRREWAKVQGRFEDIPFADSSSEVLQLVARVFRRRPAADKSIVAAIERWAADKFKQVEKLGLTDRLPNPELLASCYPLHPLALAVLPELCSRYGQRERTLFSFLARPEPYSVATFLEESTVARRRLPVVTIENVFDYFMASSGTIVYTADGATRWLEIDSRIKETQGLSDEEVKVLKTVGVLNLVSRGGSLRASRETLAYAVGPIPLDDVLESLEGRGLVVHRAFADEFRIWQGTDFDLHGAIEDAHRRLSTEALPQVYERAMPLSPLVAARHSQDKGILRFFDRVYASETELSRAPLADADGLVLYVLDGTSGPQLAQKIAATKPTVVVYPANTDQLRAAALDAASISEVLRTHDDVAADWVARRELHERAALAVERFRVALDESFSLNTPGVRLARADESELDTAQSRTWSALLSDICDEAYAASPTVRNEMIARRDLSSQAARARRDLLTAMIDHGGEPRLNIEGYGPERAMLESVLIYSGIYREREGVWRFTAPFESSDYQPAWQAIERLFSEALDRSVGLDEMWHALQAPPIGLPVGPIPILVTAALLVYADDIAVYQDGTFQPVFGAELIERLTKSPERFAVKHFATSGPRAKVISALAERLPATAPSTRRNATLIRVLAPLVRSALALPEYTRRTAELDVEAKAVRDALTHAVEPDALLFTALPTAVGMKPFSAAGRVRNDTAVAFAETVLAAVRRLDNAYDELAELIVNEIALGMGRSTPASVSEVRSELAVRAGALIDKVLEPRLRSFLLAVSDVELEDGDWVEKLAMNVAERPPRSWRDDDRARFALNLEEILRAFRRVEILHLEHLDAHPGGARARQVVVTTPEGIVQESIVWLDESTAAAVDGIVESAMGQAASVVGARAAESLLSVLAERLMGNNGARLVSTTNTANQARRANG